eukprot:CAMPEP_0184976374 /NCGR_PEP_ID=MMETSP1098-20130426/7342_1 /TAXON_ID=89044 /ORGANISM="Spumella elongata, Strain CCAP 955/1" /LENGTH=346 /DNA_ID=CAMNT_0027499235 /DNA_START=131 /DNA_END=1171 /DNA_ORIENTATION=-
MQSLLYFLNNYPDALKDLIINQELSSIGNEVTQFRNSNDGKDEMMRSSATFVGVGKNSEEHLLHNLLKDLDKLSQEFSSSRAIFVVDSTAFAMQRIFYDWAKESPKNRTIVIAVAPRLEAAGLFPDSETTLFPREGKIAQARNMVLEEYKKGPATDYMINIDLDIVGWDLGGVRDSFGQSSEWDVACANGVILYGIYRDAYALRAPGIETNHHKSGLDHAQFNITLAEKEAHRRTLQNSKRKIRKIMDGRGLRLSYSLQKSPDLVKLDSCFGGMAIYRTSAIEGCSYSHRETTVPQVVDCEHVFYHRCIAEKNQARIVSNRNMKVWYGHTSLATLDYKKMFRSFFQ